MKSAIDEIMKAWYDKLFAAINVDGTMIPVYKVWADANSNSHFIVLRPESETNDSTNAYYGKQSIILIDIVTKHNNVIDSSIVESIYNQIAALIFPNAGWDFQLESLTGFSIASVIAESSVYLIEDAGTYRLYRKIMRMVHTIIQQ